MSGIIKILVMMNQSCMLSVHVVSVVGVCHTAFLFIGYVLLINHSSISLEADKFLQHYKKTRSYVDFILWVGILLQEAILQWCS